MKNYFASFNKPKPQRPKQDKQYSASQQSETRRGPRMGYKNTQKQQAKNSTKTRRERTITLDEQARIDAILDKIKESGYDKLTAEEKAFLFKVSNKK